MAPNRIAGTTVWFPIDLLDLVDQVKVDRKDPSRSVTFRFLVFLGLDRLGYLDDDTRRGMGLEMSQRRPQLE